MESFSACKRLLNESEFAKIWNIENPKYRTWNDEARYFYTSDSNIVAILGYNDTELISLTIYNNSLIAEFLDDYKIAPYTYTYYVFESICNPIIKPFTYHIPYMIYDLEQLPLCVVYTGSYNPPSVLHDRDDEMEYTVATKLQNGEPITKLKSARN